MMLRHNLKLALRNLNRKKAFALINITGLSTGIACFILISTFVYYEWNYDDFHKDTDRIYQICRMDIMPDESKAMAGGTPMPLTATLREEYGYMGTTIGFYEMLSEEDFVTIDGQQHEGFRGVAVEQDFFKIFNFPFLIGNPEKCLEGPHDVVISERAAEQYFGNRDPMGKTFSIRNYEFMIRGVVKNSPNNTIFKYDVFFSSSVRPMRFSQLEDGWWSSGPYNFIKLNPGISPGKMIKVFQDIKNKHFPDFLKDRMGFTLQPLKQVHLNTEIAGQIYPTIDEIYLAILLVVAISILIIACINYINLATSQAGERAKETGIKKVAGASRKQLMAQYFSESIVLSLLAVFLALLLAELLLPWFNTLTSRNIDLHFYSLQFLLAVTGFGILTGLLSGIYPGLVLSSFRPVIAFKDNLTGIRRKSYLRSTLVIIQLTIALILISTEILIVKQIHYMQTTPLGYNLDHILSIPLWSLQGEQSERYEASKRFMERVESYRAKYGLSNGTVSENIPGFFIQNRFRVTNPVTQGQMEITSIAIDESFMDVFEIDLLQGQDFSKRNATSEPEKILINEAAYREMGWEEAVGKSFELWPGYYISIIGVVPDLHVESLQHPVGPLMFRYGQQNNFPQFVSFRLDPQKTQESILFLQDLWKKLFPDSPYSYFFPEEKYLEHYTEERRMAKVLATFVVVTILISGLGILGLVLFNTSTRTKEVGIRKTFGANILSIIGLLSKELIVWILIASGIAVIPAWYAMQGWLEKFAYRTAVSWWIFGLSIGFILLVTLLAAGWNTWKAARKNPVEVLRYE